VTDPIDPKHPRKNRHTLAERGSFHGAMTYRLLVQRDALDLLTWIGQAPARELAEDALKSYAMAKGWTPGYLKGVVATAQAHLQEASAETAEQARHRLVSELRAEAAACDDLVIGTAPMIGKGEGGGSIVMRDRDGNDLRRRDRSAVVAFIKLQAELLVPKEAEKHVHAHLFVARLPEPCKTVEEWEAQGDASSAPKPKGNK
jgi:hypothetical protein